MGRDQADNTVRVLRLGAGVRVKKTAGPRQFAAAVRQVLDQPSYAHAANRFAAALAREAETPPTAIGEAETLLTLGRSRGLEAEMAGSLEVSEGTLLHGTPTGPVVIAGLGSQMAVEVTPADVPCP